MFAPAGQTGGLGRRQSGQPRGPVTYQPSTSTPMKHVKFMNLQFSPWARLGFCIGRKFRAYGLWLMPFGSSCCSSRLRKTLGLGCCLLLLPVAVRGQEITDNFDLGADPGWQHYTPTTAGGALPQYSFPTSGSGKGYRMFGPP